MSVYRPKGSPYYRYDFELHGQRFSGSTHAVDRDAALEFEEVARLGARQAGGTVGPLARKIVKRAALQTVPERATAKNGYVYMLKSGYFIKIGHSFDPRDRLDSIQTATPEKCELLFCVRGSMQAERRLHEEFSACHYRGEWFFLCGNLKTFVEDMQKSGQLPKALRVPPNIRLRGKSAGKSLA